MDYSVESVMGCTIVRGSVPMHTAAELLKDAPKGAVMDFALCTRLAASLVFGLPQDLKKLHGLPMDSSAIKLAEDAKLAGVSQLGADWIINGERGISSETMFSVATGFSLLPRARWGYPRDMDDFRRCRLAFEAVPEIKAKLSLLSGVSPIWARIVEGWVELCKLMDEETPSWRVSKGYPDRASCMLEGILSDE